MGAFKGFFIARAEIFRSEGDIFFDRLFKELIFRKLKDEADELAQFFNLLSPSFTAFGDDVIIDDDFAGSRNEEAVSLLDKRRFAAAGFADDSGK
jgi:hypothetical protein